MADQQENAAKVDILSSDNKDTLFAVLQFLKKNNLGDTEALLRKEANLTEEDVKEEETSAKSATEMSQALAAYKSDGDASLYEGYYRSLEQFVEKSLDVHKCELAMVLYPVFVQMYLELVFNGHEEAAKRYFAKFSPNQEVYYESDLRQLSTVTKAEHMTGNLLLDNFKTSKFTIKMSRDSYNHLKRHLLEEKQTILLNIVQEHLFIDVFDGAPRTKLQIDATAGGMAGEAKKEANKVKVYYGLLKEPDINIPVDDDDDGDQPGTKKKKAKKDPSLMKKSKNDPNAPPPTRIPLPEMRDIDKLEKVRSIKESMKRVALGPDSLPSICCYTLLNAHQGVTSMDVCDDSSLMAAGYANSKLQVWSLTPNRLRSMKPPEDLNMIDKDLEDVLERMMDDRTAAETKTLIGHSGPVYGSSFSPDRNLMVSASEDGTVRLWSLQTWTNIVCYKGHIYPVWDVKFGPYGHYFVSAGHDRTIRLWSTDHYQPIRMFSGHLADVDTVQYHPNSNYIVSGSTDRTVRLWDVSSGNCVRVMTGHKGSIQAVSFTPDGRYIISSGTDKMVLLWDIASGDLVGQLKGHSHTVYSLCCSRDGTILASGGMDNTVKLWDMAKVMEDIEAEGISGLGGNGKSAYEIGSYPTKSTPVLNLHFTRRNLLLATGPYIS